MTLSLLERLTYSAVRIEATMTDGKTTSTGSGFNFSFAYSSVGNIPVVVTNKHVVKNTAMGHLRFHLNEQADSPPVGKYMTVNLPDFESRWIMHPDPDVDLCVLPIAGILNQLAKTGISVFQVSLGESVIPTETFLNELQPLEDIIFIGYPNGIWDSVNNMPIIRRGITATRAGVKYNGLDAFLIDAAVYPGSSGSPVFLFNQGAYSTNGKDLTIGTRMALLGIISSVFQHTARGDIVVQSAPTQNVPVAMTGIPNNLGVVIRAERIREFAPLLRTKAIAETEKSITIEPSSNR